MSTVIFESLSIDDLIEKFDRLMAAADEKVLREYESQRITGSDYATVYLGIMQAAMAQATQFSIQGATTEAEVALLNQKRWTEEAQIRNIVGVGFLEDFSGAPGNVDGVTVYDVSIGDVQPTYPSLSAEPIGGGVLGKQQVLYNKQTDGFDRDAEQKLLKIMNDLYSISMSTNDVPDPLPPENNQTGLDEVTKFAKDNIGIP